MTTARGESAMPGASMPFLAPTAIKRVSSESFVWLGGQAPREDATSSATRTANRLAMPQLVILIIKSAFGVPSQSA
jgi:hypothetical protein